MNERYANKRQLFRRAGRFTKPPTLEQQGFELADGEHRKCDHCGFEWHPILKDCRCPKCETPNAPPEPVVGWQLGEKT